MLAAFLLVLPLDAATLLLAGALLITALLITTLLLGAILLPAGLLADGLLLTSNILLLTCILLIAGTLLIAGSTGCRTHLIEFGVAWRFIAMSFVLTHVLLLTLVSENPMLRRWTSVPIGRSEDGP